ncbi:MAG: hypothetical protein AB7K37_13050 [Cyclobacteriaceae bacterium]
MKTLNLGKVLLALIVLMAAIGLRSLQAQNLEAEVPGDHFSLEGALDLFKKSKSPEDFEQLLNSPDSRVNNLDLNGDGNVDYIRVISRQDGHIHAFIMQAVISPVESQDVAVIELEKLANGEAILQITGDADIYGIETIIEPTEEVYVNAGTSTRRRLVNVWTWPSVQYIFSPYYSVWVSPWGWYDWPWWWTSWRPVAYHVYHPWWRPYRNYYSVCYTHRIAYARIYRPYRTTSVVVYNRHRDRVETYRNRRGGEKRYDDKGDGRGRYVRDGDRSRENDSRERNSRYSGDVNNGRSYQTDTGDNKRKSNDYSLDRSSSEERTRTLQRTSTNPTREVQRQQPSVSFDRVPQRIERQPSRQSQVQQRPEPRPQVQRQPAPRQVVKPSPPSNRSVTRPSPPPAKPVAPSRSGSSNNKKRGKN